MPTDDTNQVIALLGEDLDALYARFGQELTGRRLGARPSSRATRVERARAWLEANRETLCRTIGESPVVMAYLNDPRRVTRVELVTALLDASALIAGLPSPVTLVAIIIKNGVRELCPRLDGDEHPERD